MILYVFDKGLNFKGIVEGFSSLRWVRRYNLCGEFELHVLYSEETMSLLDMEHILLKKGDDEGAFINYRGIKQNNDGSETLVVKGQMLSGYLKRRIVWGTQMLHMLSEMAIRALIENNAITPTIPERKIPFLKLGSLKGFSERLSTQVSYHNLLETIEELCLISDFGFKVTLDPQARKISFELYKGVNRTEHQNENPRAVFSKAFENLLELEYTESISDYNNVTLVGGQGEGEARERLVIGDESGLNRFEVFTDANDLSRDHNGTQLTDLEYQDLLRQRGEAILKTHEKVLSFDGEVNPYTSPFYKEDFDLGDTVTCFSKAWGIRKDVQVVEIEEVYEASGFRIRPVFGAPLPTLIEKLKNKIN